MIAPGPLHHHSSDIYFSRKHLSGKHKFTFVIGIYYGRFFRLYLTLWLLEYTSINEAVLCR